MDSKFTQEEFDNHYKEFLMNPSKYQSIDLDFRMAMLMRGCSVDEFDNKITNRGARHETKLSSEPWVDNEDGDEQYDYSSKHKRHGGEFNDGGDDSNEY